MILFSRLVSTLEVFLYRLKKGLFTTRLHIIIFEAHCLTLDSSAVIGRYHWMDGETGDKIHVAEYIPHPGFDFYDDLNTNNDVMLLFLERPTADDSVIVNLNSNSSFPEVDEPVTVIGWGDTEIDSLKFEMSDVLKSAEVFVQSNKECEGSEGSILGEPTSYKGKVTKNMLCAEATGVDSCQNNSGELESSNALNIMLLISISR